MPSVSLRRYKGLNALKSSKYVVALCSIHKNVKYFETLHASELTHNILKHGLKESTHPFNRIREVSFKTLGRNFRLILTPKKGVVHSKFEAVTVDADGQETPVGIGEVRAKKPSLTLNLGTNGIQVTSEPPPMPGQADCLQGQDRSAVTHPSSNHARRCLIRLSRDNRYHEDFYDGRVFGESWSDASVHMKDGVLTATIQLADETYHIEPSWRHLSHLDNQSMVTYKASDVQFSWDHPDHPHQPCAYVKEKTDDEEEEEKGAGGEEDTAKGKERWKRQADQYEYTPTKTRCPLLLVADYRFYQEMGGSNTKTTINYLISLIDRVHKIYNDTTWQDRQDQDGFKGMGFVIKKIVVHSEATKVRGGEAHYNMVREKWDVRNLLEVFSRNKEVRRFCLAHLFTHQTFSAKGGLATVLGLAYIASPRLHSTGGICSHDSGPNCNTIVGFPQSVYGINMGLLFIVLQGIVSTDVARIFELVGNFYTTLADLMFTTAIPASN
ncbi:Disintegrin and metalloproteinase domain-containing protein 17 [Homalodisca vitripennis]|nr:Disintegrin and metalloproteinase domain-containing protein 17 [Homalodisca vitripennis]